ncbi:hypothetical protein [Pollutibacter soli]|uniref:hypothetical protein n=1 Tax=Pollutibacter soli TaxID=3034157 RepID=UPI003013BCD1
MHNLSDEELDRLSREAAGQNLTLAGDAAWEKIKSRLDAEMPSGSGFNFHIIPDLALLLILFIGLPLLLSRPGKQNTFSINQAGLAITNDTKNKLNGAENKLSAEATSQTQPFTTNKRIAENRGTTDDNGSATNNPASAVPSEVQPVDNVTVTKDRKQKSGDNSLTENNDNNVIAATNNTNSAGGKEKSTNPDTKKSNDVTAGNILPDEYTGSGIVPMIAVLEEPVALHGKYNLENKEKIPASKMKSFNGVGIGSVAKTNKTTAESVKQSKKLKLKDADSKTSRMLEIGAVWSPDISKVGAASPKSVGNIFGMTVGYNFNKRWSIQTGVLYSNKYYTATGGEYKKIPGYNPYDPWVKITKVQAECLMWDIPINVRYNWYWRPKQRAFVSTGMSSYFMKQEDLHYWYKYYNNPRYKNWINEEGSSYWFSVVNFSAGFEQQIIDGLTIQAEPFVKLSVRQLGYGYVNLKSYGIFLGLKYVPPLHRSKK